VCTAIGGAPRARAPRGPDEIEGAGWDYGTNREYLQQLVAYWRDGYDWRKQERLLNRFPQFQAIVDGFRLHFLYLKGQGPRPLPLILSHGWPGSFFEFYKVVEPLAYPARHGGVAEDAFDVVAPSLPGYGFSERPHTRGMNVARIAELFVRLMREELGSQRFGAQGGEGQWDYRAPGCDVPRPRDRDPPEHGSHRAVATGPRALGRPERQS
jgi:pimeloyl-ACP methyl ester carboxylesterase